MKTTPVVCRNLSKSFGDQTVVDDVSFGVPAGQILALLGPSGCGKTTTLRLIAGFEQADAGVILIEGQEVANGRIQLPPEKRRVGMVFQDYAIFPHLSVTSAPYLTPVVEALSVKNVAMSLYWAHVVGAARS